MSPWMSGQTRLPNQSSITTVGLILGPWAERLVFWSREPPLSVATKPSRLNQSLGFWPRLGPPLKLSIASEKKLINSGNTGLQAPSMAPNAPPLFLIGATPITLILVSLFFSLPARPG